MTRSGVGPALLGVEGLRAGYPQGFELRVSRLEVRAGELVGLMGPNGSGKSTLLRAVVGLLVAREGRILLDGESLHRFSSRERARRLAYVPQFAEPPFRSTVREVVALGRYPHLGSLGKPRAEDARAVDDAVASCSLGPLEAREVQTLSGGERQRVLLARALAQQAALLVLDEPVSNLDLRHQQETYERLRRLADDQGKGVLVADHRINLQASYCDRIVVLAEGEDAVQGTPGEIITEDLIARVFGLRMKVQTVDGKPSCSWIVPMPEASPAGAKGR